MTIKTQTTIANSPITFGVDLDTGLPAMEYQTGLQVGGVLQGKMAHRVLLPPAIALSLVDSFPMIEAGLRRAIEAAAKPDSLQ